MTIPLQQYIYIYIIYIPLNPMGYIYLRIIVFNGSISKSIFNGEINFEISHEKSIVFSSIVKLK